MTTTSPLPIDSRDSRDPLDSRWYIRVGETTYGPYTGHQLRAYIAEGRVAAQSLVAPEGGTEWVQAANDPVLAPIVNEASRITAASRAAAAAPQPQPRPAAQPQAQAQPELANFVLVFDLKSRPSARLEQAIMNLGPACKLSSNIWIIASRETSGSIRNMLIEYFGKVDTLLVVDASRGKAAWFNFGPEQDARIRRVWRQGSERQA